MMKPNRATLESHRVSSGTCATCGVESRHGMYAQCRACLASLGIATEAVPPKSPLQVRAEHVAAGRYSLAGL